MGRTRNARATGRATKASAPTTPRSSTSAASSTITPPRRSPPRRVPGRTRPARRSPAGTRPAGTRPGERSPTGRSPTGEDQEGPQQDQDPDDDHADAPDESADESADESEEQGEDEPEVTEEDRLAEIVSAPTQGVGGAGGRRGHGRRAHDHPEGRLRDHLELREGRIGDDLGFKAVQSDLGFPVWLRFLTASFVIVASVAAATSASLILYLSDFADALKKNALSQDVNNILDNVPSSGAQTFLIIGSDHRNQPDQRQVRQLGHDDAAPPRPGPERDRPALDPARSQGLHPWLRHQQDQRRLLVRRPEADLETVKQITGLQVNHLVNVDFIGLRGR